MKRNSPLGEDCLEPKGPVPPPLLISDEGVNEKATSQVFKPSSTSFLEFLFKIPLISFNPFIFLQSQDQEPSDLLPGSLLETSNLFGIEIDRQSHIKKAETFFTDLNHSVERNTQNLDFINSNFYVINFQTQIISHNNKDISLQSDHAVDCDGVIFQIIDDSIHIQIHTTKKSLTIESYSSLIIDKITSNLNQLRIISENLTIDAKLQCDSLHLISNEFITINEKIQINNSCLLQSNEINIRNEVNGNSVLISNECSITKSTFNSNFSFIYSKESLTISSIFNVNTLVLQSPKINLATKEENIITNVFIKSKSVSISSKIKSEKMIIETETITFDSKTNVNVTDLTQMYFIPRNGRKTIGKNSGILKFNNFWFETIIFNEKLIPIFTNTKSMIIQGAFLLNIGNFSNAGNIIIRSLSISSKSQFSSSKNSQIKFGDLLVVNKSGKLVVNGRVEQYSYLIPIILNSGIISINNTKDIIKCQKIVSNNYFNGSFKIDANDIVSFAGNNEWKNVSISSKQISIVKNCEIIGNKINLSCDLFEIVFSKLNALNSSSCLTIKYTNEFIDENGTFDGWLKFDKIKEIRETSEERNQTESETPTKNKNVENDFVTPQSGNKRTIPKYMD